MISCPKCGFTQPKDQFCASCGVDMEKYQSRALKIPLFRRAARNSLLQALVIIAVVVVTSVSIYRKKKVDLLSRLDQGSALLDESLLATSTPTPRKAVTPVSTHQAANPSDAAARHLILEEEQAALEDDMDEERTPAALTPSLRVFLAEASVSYLTRLSDLRPLSSLGATTGAMVANLEGHLQAGRANGEVRTLIEKTFPMRLGESSEFNQSTLDEMNTPLGLEVFLRPTSLDERGLHFQVSVTRSLRETPDTPPQPFRYNESITLTNEAGVLLYGLLPKRRPFPTENLLPDFIQDLMNSPEFLTGAEDLVLLIEGKGLPEAR